MSDMLEKQLMSDEHILWSGAPGGGLILRPIEVFLVPFSLLWGGFAVMWNTQVWSTDAPLDFKLFGLPFLLAALYVTVGRFLIDIAVRRTISYAITDRRILIVRSGWRRSVKSFDLARLPSIELQERSNGTGSIRFGPAVTLFGNNGFGIWSPAFDPTPQFQNIGDPRSVYEIVQTASRAAENKRP